MIAFFQKECRVAWRRYRWLLLAVVFIVFGIEGPLIAKLTPALLKAAGGSGVVITIPKPTSVTAWGQYYKNMTQLGLYLLALVTSGTVARELAEGTLVNLVTKGLARPVVILAKYLIAVLEWAGCMLLAFAVSWAYTAYYFPDAGSPHPWPALLPLLVFGLLWQALVVLGSTLTRSSFTGFLVAAATQLALAALNWFKAGRRFNPIRLISDNLAVLQGTKTLGDLAPALAVTVVAAAGLVLAAIAVLNRKRL